MRITAKVSAAGHNAHLSIPNLPKDANRFLTEGGGLDERAAREYFRTRSWCRLDNADDRAVIAVAVEVIDRIQLSLANYAESGNDAGMCVVEDGDGHKVDAAERRMKRGKGLPISVDIRRAANGFRICVGWANPNEAVGSGEESAAVFADVFARVILQMVDDFKEQQAVNFTLVDGRNCAGLFASAAKSRAERALRFAHKDCERRTNGYCSPINPQCPFYRAGRCGI